MNVPTLLAIGHLAADLVRAVAELVHGTPTHPDVDPELALRMGIELDKLATAAKGVVDALTPHGTTVPRLAIEMTELPPDVA